MNTTEFVQDHIDQMKQIETNILLYLNDDEENDQTTLFKFLKEQKIEINKYKLKELLHLISKISKHHHRTPVFFTKIEAIIKHIQKEIKSNFSNFDIFNIFKGNKRILLFLFEEKIIIPEVSMLSIILNEKYSKRSYPQYFKLEFNINNQNLKDEMKNIDIYKQKRKNGTNDEYLCTLIQQDLVEDFISHVTFIKLPLSSTINKSIYETNTFLLDKTPTLIEYAAFYGSIQILQYLFMNQVELKPSLWYYSIHSNNPQLIHFLEENKVPLYSNYETDFFDDLLNESIKCHHTEIMNYITNNFRLRLSIQYEYSQSLRYYNFIDLSTKKFNLKSNNLIQFLELIKYDYIIFINHILPNLKLNLNESKSYRIPNSKDNNRYTIKFRNALQLAVEKRRTEIVELLIKHPKVDINCKSIDDEYLTEHIFSIGRIEMSPLLLAINDCNFNMFILLLSRSKIDLSNNNRVIVHDFYNDKMKVKIPILVFAVAKRQYDIVKYLLLTKSDIDVNEKTETLNDSSKCGKKSGSIFNLPLRKPTANIKSNQEKDSNYVEKTALHFAVENEDLELINLLLLRQDIDINAKSIEKRNSNYVEKTALHIAVEKRNFDVIKILLNHEKINTNAKSKECLDKDLKTPKERTAFNIAIENNDQEIISLFIKEKN